MSLTPDVYLQIRDAHTYAPKLLDPGVVTEVTWDYQEQGGLAQIQAKLAVAWEFSGIAAGDYMEAWVLGESVPRARGIVSTPEKHLDLKESYDLIAMGRMADMDKVLDYKVIYHPSGSPQDLSYYAAEILSDYQQRKAVGSAVAPTLDIDIQITGSNMESLTLSPGSLRSGCDQLYNQAGGNIVWGWDIHPVTGNDRFYFRLRTAVVGYQCFVGDKVKLIMAPQELVPVTNAVYLKGGPAKFPNLITNASFEQPTNPSADSGSSLVNGGFEFANPGHSAPGGGVVDALGWAMNGSVTRNTHDPSTNHNASPHTGSWYLLLDSTAKNAVQDVAIPATSITNGVAYLLTAFTAAENAGHLPTGAITVTGISSSGSVTETPLGAVLPLAPKSAIWSGGAASSVVGSDALQTSMVFTNPSTVKARITITYASGGGAGYALLVDDVSFGPVGAVGQYGWGTHLQNPGSPSLNAFNWIIWACKAAAFDGAYGVRTSVTADFSDKPALAIAGQDNSGDSRFHFKPAPQQSLTCGFFVRMTPGMNSGPGSVTAEYREWAGDGHQTQYQQFPATTSNNIPNDGLWHMVAVSISAHGDVSTATTQATFGTSGVYDIDGFFARDSAAVIVNAQDPQTANYLRGADFERYVTAEAVCTSGSAADLAASASYATWGRREAVLSNDQIIDWTTDAAAYLQAYFQRAAVLRERPRVELDSNAQDIILPGDGTQIQVSGTGADIAPQWCSHATYSWKKMALGISLELSNERPTWAKLLKAAQGSGGSAGSSVGAPSGAGQTGAGTPAQAAISVTDGTTTVSAQAIKFVGASVAIDGTTATQADVTITAAFTPSAPVPPSNIFLISSLYSGSAMALTFGAAFYAADPAGAAQICQWQQSTDSGTTWTGNDGTSATYYPGSNLFPIGLSSGTIRVRVRAENPLGAVSAWRTMTSDVSYAAPAALVTSVAGRTGVVTLSTSDISGLGTAATHPATDFDASGAAAAVLATSLQKSANLSDVASVSTARTSLGLGTAATKDVPATGNASATQVVLGNDTRLSAGVSLSTTTPAADTVGGTGAVGTGTTAAKADHVHPGAAVFGASGSSHAAGFVPDPGATAGTAKYLREDGTWVAPKRRLAIYFYPTSTTADSAPNTTQMFRLPESNGGAATNWKCSGPTYLHTENGTATATTFQGYYAASSGLFSAGTAVLGSALSVTGTGRQEASTTTFSGTLATTGLASGTEISPKWAAQTVAGTYAMMQFEEV